MLYRVIDNTMPLAPRVLANGVSYDSALALVPGEIVYLSEDEEHPEHFDLFTSYGHIISIEPKAETEQ